LQFGILIFSQNPELIGSLILQSHYRLSCWTVMKFSRLLPISGLLMVAAAIAPGLSARAAVDLPAAEVSASNQIALLQVSDEELRKYAAALIEIEPLRVEALNSIRSRVAGDLPNLMCNQPDSMSGLPSDARKIFVRYCANANEIANRKGLSMAAFNRITGQVASSPQLRKRLQQLVN
jgi:hypothetical protein